MSLGTDFGAILGETLSSSNSVIVSCNGATVVLALFRSLSGSITYKVYLSVDGTNYTPQRCFNYKTGVETAADAGIAAANDDLYIVPCAGAHFIKLERTAGAGSVVVDSQAAYAGESLADVSVASLAVAGDVADDAADSGNPVKIGAKAVSFGATPTEVAANDRTDLHATRFGVLWTLGGHMNAARINARVLDSDGAQSNVALVTVSAGTAIVCTQATGLADGSNSGPFNLLAGFAAATLATPNTTSGAGILLDFLGCPAGGGLVIGNGGGVIGFGADGEDLRYTTEDPASGALTLGFTYFTTAA